MAKIDKENLLPGKHPVDLASGRWDDGVPLLQITTREEGHVANARLTRDDAEQLVYALCAWLNATR